MHLNLFHLRSIFFFITCIKWVTELWNSQTYTFTLYHHGTTTLSLSEICHSCNSSHNDHCQLAVAAKYHRKRKIGYALLHITLNFKGGRVVVILVCVLSNFKPNLLCGAWQHGQNADADRTYGHRWRPWIIQYICMVNNESSKMQHFCTT